MNFDEWIREERRCGRKPSMLDVWRAALRHGVEPANTSTNTGIPKLPLMRFEVYEALGCTIVAGEGVATERYRSIVNDVYDLLERQLRAGA